MDWNIAEGQSRDIRYWVQPSVAQQSGYQGSISNQKKGWVIRVVSEGTFDPYFL